MRIESERSIINCYQSREWSERGTSSGWRMQFNRDRRQLRQTKAWIAEVDSDFLFLHLLLDGWAVGDEKVYKRPSSDRVCRRCWRRLRPRWRCSCPPPTPSSVWLPATTPSAWPATKLPSTVTIASLKTIEARLNRGVNQVSTDSSPLEVSHRRGHLLQRRIGGRSAADGERPGGRPPRQPQSARRQKWVLLFHFHLTSQFMKSWTQHAVSRVFNKVLVLYCRFVGFHWAGWKRGALFSSALRLWLRYCNLVQLGAQLAAPSWRVVLSTDWIYSYAWIERDVTANLNPDSFQRRQWRRNSKSIQQYIKRADNPVKVEAWTTFTQSISYRYLMP